MSMMYVLQSLLAAIKILLSLEMSTDVIGQSPQFLNSYLAV